MALTNGHKYPPPPPVPPRKTKAPTHTGAARVQVGGRHYLDMGLQPWDAMQAWMAPDAFAGFLRGNAIKYLARCDAKGGVQDLKKARHYLDKLIELLEPEL